MSAFLLLVYGSSKLAHLQFHMNQQLAGRAVSSLTGYQLTWYYYGYSRVYACVLGLTQVAGGCLLLFRKTALLGAIAMFPVMANVLLIDLLILPPDYGPAIPACLILSALTLLLLRDAAALLQVTWTLQQREPSQQLHLWVRALIVATVVGMGVFGAVLMRR